MVVSACIRPWLGDLDDECILQGVEHLTYIIYLFFHPQLYHQVHLIFCIHMHFPCEWSELESEGHRCNEKVKVYDIKPWKIDCWVYGIGCSHCCTVGTPEGWRRKYLVCDSKGPSARVNTAHWLGIAHDLWQMHTVVLYISVWNLHQQKKPHQVRCIWQACELYTAFVLCLWTSGLSLSENYCVILFWISVLVFYYY